MSWANIPASLTCGRAKMSQKNNNNNTKKT